MSILFSELGIEGTVIISLIPFRDVHDANYFDLTLRLLGDLSIAYLRDCTKLTMVTYDHRSVKTSHPVRNAMLSITI